MLVLTRKIEEQFRIGDDITISILRVKGNTVRVGIDAPRAIRVVRGELLPHKRADTSSSLNATLDVAVAESSQREEGAMLGDEESAGPATTAVRQFLAKRARRQHRPPKFRQSVDRAVATTMTRLA